MNWFKGLTLGLVLGLSLLPAIAAPVVSVICLQGCSGTAGTFNNNSDNVATSADNGKTAAWMYGWDGAAWDRLRVDGSSNLNVNCASGCAGGTFNNNSDNVATSATNGQSAAWLYGWDGSAWDRVPATSTDGLLVNLGANNDVVVSGSVALLAGTNNIGDVDVLTLPSIPAGTNNIGDVDVLTLPALPTGTNLIGQVQDVGGASGGLTKFTLQAAASTNATSIKASAGTVYHIEGFGTSATPAWVTFYNTAGAPTCGTGIVWQTIIPGVSTGAGGIMDIAKGLDFSTGIGICITTGIGGTGAVAAGTFVLNIGYK